MKAQSDFISKTANLKIIHNTLRLIKKVTAICKDKYASTIATMFLGAVTLKKNQKEKLKNIQHHLKIQAALYAKHCMAYFLLLGFLAAEFPMYLLHQHEAQSIMLHNDNAIETDPCHIAIYHEKSLDTKCKHESHVSDSQEQCVLCAFISTRRFQYLYQNQPPIYLALFNKTYPTEICLPIISYTNDSNLGRGPPLT